MIKNVILGIILAALSLNVFAKNEAEHGIYGFLSLGRGYTNFSRNEFASNLNGHGNDWTPSARVGLGFNIDKYIGLESGWRYFHDRKFKDLNSSGLTGIVKEQAYDLLTVVRWPFGDGFNLLAKFGPAYVIANQKLNQQNTAFNARNIYSWRAVYALGLSMTLDDFPGLSMQAEYSAVTGDSSKHLPESELYTLGFIFQF